MKWRKPPFAPLLILLQFFRRSQAAVAPLQPGRISAVGGGAQQLGQVESPAERLDPGIPKPWQRLICPQPTELADSGHCQALTGKPVSACSMLPGTRLHGPLPPQKPASRGTQQIRWQGCDIFPVSHPWAAFSSRGVSKDGRPEPRTGTPASSRRTQSRIDV